MVITPQDFYLPLIKKTQIAQHTYAFTFDRRGEPEFAFLPGQWLRMTLPIPNPDSRGNHRPFSFSSSPLNKETIELTMDIGEPPSAFKQVLINLVPGTLVQFFGPSGIFVLDEIITQPQIFLTGGIGLVPIMSMIEYAIEIKCTELLLLIASFSLPEQIIFQERLALLSQKCPNLRVIYTLSKVTTSLEQGTHEVGRISDELLDKYTQGLTAAVYYTCGPFIFTTAMEQLLYARGVLREQIRKEIFVG